MPKAVVKSGKIRLQFDFTQEAVDRVDTIRERLDEE